MGKLIFSLSTPLSAELVDKCIGSRIHIVMKSDKEIVGTLLGFDDFVSILLKRWLYGFFFRFLKKNYRLSVLTVIIIKFNLFLEIVIVF